VKRLAVGVALVVAIVVVPMQGAWAHPLGNFTINQYSGLHVGADRVLVDLVTDMAEIPTFQIKGDIDTNHNGAIENGEARVWQARECAAQGGHVAMRLDGRAVRVQVDAASALTFPPGQAGLATLRLECRLQAELGAINGVHAFSYRNTNFAGRIGWREITAVGDGATLEHSDVGTTSLSKRLTSYPKDLLRSPLAQRTANLRMLATARRGSGRTAPPAPVPGRALPGSTKVLPRGVDRATRAFTDLVARRRLTVGFGALALVLAIVLGALHALAPGHGKTVMAAYLVGERGSLRHAGLIGLTVTATHTTGVMILGLLLSTSAVIAPERLYPWLGLASGLMLASIGAGLVVRAVRARRSRSTAARHAHVHANVNEGSHDTEHVHTHGGGPHVHGPVDPARTMGWRSLIAMGLAGGMVPSPSALVVLLGAIALGRAWFGLVLVVAYGLGMAATLTGAGLMLVRARSAFDRKASESTRSTGLLVVARALPLATASIIVVVGVFLAARGAAKI
jgi:nickel/cobalt transporter (NicO) family protein